MSLQNELWVADISYFPLARSLERWKVFLAFYAVHCEVDGGWKGEERDIMNSLGCEVGHRCEINENCYLSQKINLKF